MPEEAIGWERRLRLELWSLGQESQRLFAELPEASVDRISALLDELQLVQALSSEKLTALRALVARQK